MKHVLTKISEPGWEKTFNSEEEVFTELNDWICSSCYAEFYSDYRSYPQNVNDLLNTYCGAEFIYETEEGIS